MSLATLIGEVRRHLANTAAGREVSETLATLADPCCDDDDKARLTRDLLTAYQNGETTAADVLLVAFYPMLVTTSRTVNDLNGDDDHAEAVVAAFIEVAATIDPTSNTPLADLRWKTATALRSEIRARQRFDRLELFDPTQAPVVSEQPRTTSTVAAAEVDAIIDAVLGDTQAAALVRSYGRTDELAEFVDAIHPGAAADERRALISRLQRARLRALQRVRDYLDNDRWKLTRALERLRDSRGER